MLPQQAVIVAQMRTMITIWQPDVTDSLSSRKQISQPLASYSDTKRRLRPSLSNGRHSMMGYVSLVNPEQVKPCSDLNLSQTGNQGELVYASTTTPPAET